MPILRCWIVQESFFAYQKLMSESLRSPKEEDPSAGQASVYLRVRRQYRLVRETMSGLTKLFPLVSPTACWVLADVASNVGAGRARHAEKL